MPDLDKLVKLSQIFGVSLDELVTGEAGPAAEEAPPETPAAPAAQAAVPGRMPGRKIAGIVLFCMAFLTCLLLNVAGSFFTGLFLAAPFLVCSVICFLARKRPGLWCAWALYLTADVFFYYATGLYWAYMLFTFPWQEIDLTPVYGVTAWIQVLVTLVLLIATVRSFRTEDFPPTRRNGVILALVWAGFLVSSLPFVYLVLPLGAYVLSIGTLVMLTSTVQGVVSLILLAIALTLSVRMIAAWRASKR